ncbi:hypothetical protein O9K51_02789 [Purpureocillium lavendulum]|uniref:Uncharacterized protein n=1 Tax=Purpureocillium lavendulum TaxID=1247861 RepID=A0AB34FZ44_9HYPO|nr:hypothetical protein O9K51_02789 [Purpureocillium lavendulum]
MRERDAKEEDDERQASRAVSVEVRSLAVLEVWLMLSRCGKHDRQLQREAPPDRNKTSADSASSDRPPILALGSAFYKRYLRCSSEYVR